ncbi:hypothetical protein JC794_16325 [Morganella morganii]|uniref:hypothetical protein n=1 Tax=Morganella morganii TaxID=582 RepID=UPI001C4953E4|nr:hypothetical protein [Morganella morganii]QXO57049.1 hypothetical protein JC827_16340 [Morganella morganii]QXO76009.1 hypothetical protein JC794_16325 [Morganella morganii]
MFVKNGGRLVDCTVVCTAANGIAWLLLWGRLLFTHQLWVTVSIGDWWQVLISCFRFTR